jgi:hypothetical protein
MFTEEVFFGRTAALDADGLLVIARVSDMASGGFAGSRILLHSAGGGFLRTRRALEGEAAGDRMSLGGGPAARADPNGGFFARSIRGVSARLSVFPGALHHVARPGVRL